MTDSIDKKSNEKRDSLDVDLDALLDEAESSLLPVNELQDEEDAIDRLLMNAGFDADEGPMQTDAKAVEDAGLYDELDDFLSIDGFGKDFDVPEKTQAAETGELEQAVDSLPVASLNKQQDEEDAIDRLLMNVSLDGDIEQDVAAFEEPDDFSDFSDFNEPDMVSAAKAVEPEQVSENSSSPTDDAALAEEIDEFADFDGFGDGFDESDLIQDDEVEVSAPAAVADLSAYNEGRQVAVKEPGEDDAVGIEELDDFSDFSDFNEPEMIPTVEVEEAGQITENLLSSTDDVDVADEVDEFADFDGFGDGFDESDLIQDDELEVPAPVVAGLSADNEDQQIAVKGSGEDDAIGIERLDDFSGFSNFNEPDVMPKVEAEDPKQVSENLSSPTDDAGLADEIDEFADFDGFGDGFDESDLIQDDEIEASVPAVADLIADNEEPQAVVEELSNDLHNDENSFDSLFADIGFDAEDALEQADEKTDELSNEADDFSGFGDDFDASDLIKDDEAETPIPAKANEEQLATVDELSSDFQGDENSFDSLFADVGLEAEEELEQMSIKEGEFGDDADLNDFFQLDGGSDDFSKQIEEAQLAETEKSLTQEDDFLLPDFDITADTEMSDIGGNSGIKQDEFADAFGDTDFLNEDETVQASEPETAELQSSTNQDVAEAEPKQAADTGNVESVEKVKLEPFGFEREDMLKQLEEAEKKVKKTKTFSYVALGFGTVALSVATGLGVMTYNAKSEVAKLTEAVSSLEANLAKNVANPPNEEIKAMRNSVVQLNQQVNGFITELKGNPQSPIDLLNNKVPDIAAKQDMVSKALDVLQVKVGVEGKASSESSVAEPPKIEAAHEPAPVKEAAVHETAPVKTEAVSSKKDIVREPASSKEVVAHKIASTKDSDMHGATPAKVETAPVKVKTEPEAVTAKPAQPIEPPKAVVKEEPVKEKRPEAVAKWGVNLVAFKQEWFAKSKAAEFARQGIFAEVIPVHERNTTMYRLRVGGFKTKAEANANTARIKQTLNLDSVWVSDN